MQFSSAFFLLMFLPTVVVIYKLGGRNIGYIKILMWDCLLFLILMFPQLVAGPIVRCRLIEEKIKGRQ